MLLRFLSARLRPYRWQVLAVTLLLLVQALGNLYVPTLNADLINQGVVKTDLSAIWHYGELMLVVVLVIAVVSVIGIWIASKVAMSVGRDLRREVFTSVQSFSETEFARFGSASLITRNTNDVQQVLLLVQVGLTIMVLAPIQAIGGVIMAMRQDLRLSTLLVVAVPTLGLVIFLIMRRAVPLFRTLQVRIDAVNRVLREQITGIRVVRAFAREEHEVERFAQVNDELTTNALQVNRLFVIAMPAMMLILNLSSVAVIWFGGHLVDQGQMQIGTLTAFLSYIMQILVSVLMAVMVIVLVPRAAASAERITAVVTTVPAVADPAEPRVPERFDGSIQMRGVAFRYPGAADPVLSDIDLEVVPGVTTAVVGSTGSGKTTLINLITRQFDVSAGSLEIDGLDIRERRRTELWSRLGLVPQRAYLFAGTIADNLRLGAPEATDEDLWWALGIAQAVDFVSALPLGLAAPVSQGGANLSGGQRQRIAIARAVVRRPAIYLFDDCFAALDTETDARLRTAMERELTGATIVIVAQRISTILGAQRIVVLDEGRVVGVGAHADLLDSCDTYREIVASQLGPAVAS